MSVTAARGFVASGVTAGLRPPVTAGAGFEARNCTGIALPPARSWPVPWLPPAGASGEATTCSRA